MEYGNLINFLMILTNYYIINLIKFPYINMILRNGKRINEDVEIDFDYASKCWRKNKKSYNNGTFSYK